MAAGAGGGSARGGAGGHRRPRDGRGGGRGAGEQNRAGRGNTRGTEEEGRGAAEATETKAMATGRRGQSDDLPEQRTNTIAGGKYCVGISKMEESADKSAECGDPV